MKLRKWQEDALSHTEMKRAYIDAKPRMGKTLYGVLYQRQFKKTLIIAPKGVCPTWFREMQKHDTKEAYLLVDMLLKPLLRSLERVKASKGGVCVVIGIGAVKGREKRGNRYVPVGVLKLLMEIGFDCLIVDEAHQIAADNSLRGRCVRWLADGIPNIRLMSGTPLPNGPESAWGQYSILGPERWGTSYHNHKKKHFIRESWDHDRVVGLRYPHQFQDMIDKYTLRYDREEEFGADQFVNNVVELPMNDSLRKIYVAAFDDWVLTQDEHDVELDLTHTLSRMLRLRELCAGYLPNEDGTKKEIHRIKVDAVLEDARQIIDSGEKVVIFCQFTWEVELYAQCLGCPTIQGAQSADERDTIVRSFNGSVGGACIVVQTQAGGVGISLASAKHAIFTSQSYSYVDEEQAHDRIFAPGQQRFVTYYRMEHSIENFVAWILENKKDFADAVKNKTIHQIAFGLEYQAPRFKRGA